MKSRALLCIVRPVKRFLELARAPFFTAIIMPGVFGALLAWRATGQLDGLRLVLVLVGLVAAHAGANLANDYYDFRLGADRNNPYRNRFSGGSPHLVEGRERPGVFLAMSAGSFFVALASGVALSWMVDRGVGPVIWLAVAGFLCGFFYTASPLKLVYRGLGEALIFLAFGVLPVLGSWYVQTRALSMPPVLASLPLALLITNILWINEFPDCASDTAAGKRHLVSRLGPSLSRFLYEGMAAAAFLLIAALSFTPLIGTWGLLGLGGLPLALAASVSLHRNYLDPPALVKAQGLTIGAHTVTGILLCAGLVLGR